MAEGFVTEALDALRRGDFAAARSLIRDNITGQRREVQHYLIEGLASLAMADWSAARDVFRAACEAFPTHPPFWFNRALAEENLGLLDEAEASYHRTLDLKPDQGEAWGNLSNIARRRGRYADAENAARRALNANAPRAEALNVLALALSKQGRFAEAETALGEALTLAPNDAAFLANRANLAIDQLKFDEAWGFFAAARSAGGGAVVDRDEGMARLLAGDYAKGLPLYEARTSLPNALRIQPPCPRWQGEAINGKTLLLISEQGFGDTIQFSRYAQTLADAGADLVWVVRQPLQRLLAGNLPGRVVTEGEVTIGGILESSPPLAGGIQGGLANTGPVFTSPPPSPPASWRGALTATPNYPIHADFWLPILSLPFMLGMTAAVPPITPVFRAPDTPRLPHTSGKRKIGLVWRGSPTHERDHERSIPLALLEPLWTTIDAAFFAPFKGAAESLHGTTAPITPLDPLINDFADAAALMAQMDGLITVDTASAHLGGALGIPTYVLLPHCPDWRWGAEDEATGWYPSVTLLRQSRYGDWRVVVQKLLEKL